MLRFMKKMDLRSWLSLGFVLGCVISLLGRQLSHGDNRNFRDLQPELAAPDVIDTVLCDPESGWLYVCYDDANQVDVYTEDGKFLWAVAAPYIRNTDFLLQGDNLILYGNGEAYLYRSADGMFVEHRDSDGLGLPRSQADQCPEETGFSSYRVWRNLESGEKQVLVNRPWWHRLFDFMLNWCFSMACAAGMGVLTLLEKARARREIQNELTFSTNRARRLHNFYRCGAGVLLFLIALEFLLSVLGVCPIFILFPVTGCFILSGILADNLLDRTALLDEERKAISFWRACHVGAYILLFAASIGALMLWDGLRQ